jgi:phytepsin
MLAIGELPEGVNNDSLTWVQVRGYPPSAGGLTAPAGSPNELYPITWEIPLDDVYLDGQKLPRSSLSPSNISLTALVDTVSHSQIRPPISRRQFPCCRAILLFVVLPMSSNL